MDVIGVAFQTHLLAGLKKAGLNASFQEADFSARETVEILQEIQGSDAKRALVADAIGLISMRRFTADMSRKHVCMELVKLYMEYEWYTPILSRFFNLPLVGRWHLLTFSKP